MCERTQTQVHEGMGRSRRKDKNKWKTGGTSNTIINKKIRQNMVRVDLEYPTGWSFWNVHIQLK